MPAVKNFSRLLHTEWPRYDVVMRPIATVLRFIKVDITAYV